MTSTIICLTPNQNEHMSSPEVSTSRPKTHGKPENNIPGDEASGLQGLQSRDGIGGRLDEVDLAGSRTLQLTVLVTLLTENGQDKRVGRLAGSLGILALLTGDLATALSEDSDAGDHEGRTGGAGVVQAEAAVVAHHDGALALGAGFVLTTAAAASGGGWSSR